MILACICLGAGEIGLIAALAAAAAWVIRLFRRKAGRRDPLKEQL